MLLLDESVKPSLPRSEVASPSRVPPAPGFGALRHRRCFSVAELNATIWELLPALNARPMRQLGVSRRELFEQLDRPALRPLPATRYEVAEWRVGGRAQPGHLAGQRP